MTSLEGRATELEPLGRLAAALGDPGFDRAEDQPPKSVRLGPAPKK